MNRAAMLALTAALGLSFATGCKKEEEAASQPPVTKPADPVAPPTEPPPEAKPVAAAYSPEAGKQAISELSACSSQYGCPAFETLVGFGGAAVPELLALVGDLNASKDARGLGAATLAKIASPDAGLKLIEIANALPGEDSLLAGDLYEAAGKSGGQPTFDALIAAYATAIASSDDNRDIPLRGGLRGFPTESVGWVKATMPSAKDNYTGYADLLTDSASAVDLPLLNELLGQTKHVMARNRIAAKAIELGDKAHFDVFVAGLSSKDGYDRSDAANFLANVAQDAPADLKPTLVELLYKGKAGDAGGITSMGYNQSLKKLGAPVTKP